MRTSQNFSIAFVFALLFWVSGCGSSADVDGAGGGFSSDSSSPPTALTIRHVVQRAIDSEVAELRVRVLDVQGGQVQIEQSFAASALVELTVPPNAATVEIDYLDATSVPMGSFATSVDPNAGPIVIENPAWVDTEDRDPTVYRFAFMGCNRLSFDDLSADNPSSANRAQLLADFNTLPSVSPAVSHLFFAGDLVANLDPGTATLQSQLTAWLELFQTTALAQSSIQMVTFTGNHEVLESQDDPDTGESVEVPNPATLPVWVSLMESFIAGSNGPTTAAPNLDQVTQDQSRLSYSFQDGNVLYVILNTDTFIDLVTLGDVPLNWLQQTLAQAEADNTVEHVFVMGHKPIVSPPGATEGPGAGSIRTEEKSPFAQLLAGNSKVRGYLCAHAHLWDYATLEGGTPQVIAGNGGSKVEPPFDDTGRGFYGYTLYSLHASGTVHLESWGRPVPDPYNAPGPQPEATLRERRLLVDF